MTTSACTVLIAAPDLLAELERAAEADGEVLAFADADALRAFEAIAKRRPRVITLDHLFAATARGAALISRVKADPTLSHSEIRVVSASGEPLLARASAGAEGGTALDQWGTRRAPRFRIVTELEVLVDGNTAVLVDLSSRGAQVVGRTTLRPNQRVRLALADEQATVRIGGVVAWASFEMPAGHGPRYRAGIEFTAADHAAVDAFCSRHRADA